MNNFWQKITSPFKKATQSVGKTIGDFFAPAPDQVRVRDFVREVPGAAETVGKKVLEFGKDILRAGPRAAASATLSAEGQKEFTPGTGVAPGLEKFLFGSEPIKDVRTRGEETVNAFGGSQQTAKKYGLPAGLALTALDLIPVVPEEKVGQELTQQLIEKYGDDVAQAIIKKGGKSLAEKAIAEGGEKVLGKAGLALTKAEPVIEVVAKTAEDISPIAQETGKIKIAPLEQAIKKFDETGSAIIGEDVAKGVRLIIKDEGDFIKVGVDAGTGKLLPTDISLPEKTFQTKEEAFDFIKSLAKPNAAEAETVIKNSAEAVPKVADVPKNLTTGAEQTLEAINDKGTPVIKQGKKIAPDALRADQIKPLPPGETVMPAELPLAGATPSPEGSALDAIDKMVGKTGKVQSVVDWLKAAPKKFTQAFSDRFAGMKDFEDNLSKMAGKPIDIESSPYVAARMYAGRTGTVEAELSDLQKVLKPIASERPDFTRFVLAKRAAERAVRGFINPANVTEADAIQALSELKSKVGENTFAIFEQAEQGLQGWANRAILKPATDAGIISKDTYNSILSKNQHWLPFQILDYLPDFKEADQVKTGGEIFSVSKQGIIKGLEGSEKTIRDPFEAIIGKLSQAVGLIKRNEVASKLISLRDELPQAADLIKPLEKSTKAPKGWGSISVFIEGKNTKWAVPEELSWAMHQMNDVEAGVMGSFLKFTSSAFRKGATNLYLPFSLSNAVRDSQMAVMTAKYGFNPADWAKGFYEGLKSSFGWESKLAEDFNRSGGGFGGFLQSAREVGGIKDKLFEPSWWRKTKAVINPFNLLNNFAEAIELAPRLGVYNKAVKKGASTLEAAFEARNSTIDFAKSGQEMRIINMWVPFVNARWQALLNTARIFKERPIQSAAKATALIVIPGVTAYLWNTTNYPHLYDDIPQWIKDSYFPIIVGEDKDKDGNPVPKTVMIPKGDVGQIFYNPIEYTMDYIRRGEPANFARLALEWMSQIAPVPFARDGQLSGTELLSGALPPAIKTPIELATNQSFFTGGPIVPRKLENVSGAEQYDENTPKLAVTIGRALGVSPMNLAYGAGSMLGGFGREVIDPTQILDLTAQRFYKAAGGQKNNEAWNVRDEAVVGYNTARQQALRAIQDKDINTALKIIRDWNASAEKVLPDILPYLAKDDPQEAAKIKNSLTFQPQDISQMQKSVYQKQIDALKKPKPKGAASGTTELEKMRQSIKK